MELSRKEIRTSVLSTSRQPASQIGDLVNEFINLTLSEINDPAWAFPRKAYNHLWNFLRRKHSVSVSAESCVLPKEVDKIAFMRQTDSPAKLIAITDEKFYKLVPNPESEGNPRFYRLWETEGVSTRLTTADTIDVVSDSASDSGDSELQVSVSGFVSGVWRTETFTLNGVTAVSGSLTFDADRVIIVSKQKDTAGTITVTENSGGTTLVDLAPDDRAPKFKVVRFYPIPSSAITIYLEYYTHIPMLENDSDVPIFSSKWHYIVRLGALAKVYQYLNKEQDFIATQQIYSKAVQAMVASDSVDADLLSHMSRRKTMSHSTVFRSEDEITE